MPNRFAYRRSSADEGIISSQQIVSEIKLINGLVRLCLLSLEERRSLEIYQVPISKENLHYKSKKVFI
ncbi:hypothetical protein SUGI_0502140 [Cryptomeria japonica]|nr:hypothetical protein SUGI_0502140 [Cryptomeria japonica]